MLAALVALGTPGGWARTIPDVVVPALWCTGWDSEGFGFLLLLVALRLAAGLLPEPVADPHAKRRWPRFLVTIVGAVTPSCVASRVLDTPRHDAETDAADVAPDDSDGPTRPYPPTLPPITRQNPSAPRPA